MAVGRAQQEALAGEQAQLLAAAGMAAMARAPHTGGPALFSPEPQPSLSLHSSEPRAHTPGPD